MDVDDTRGGFTIEGAGPLGPSNGADVLKGMGQADVIEALAGDDKVEGL